MYCHFRYVRDSELEEGLQGTMDRKSFKSLLARLVRDEAIKIFKIEVEIGAKKQELTLVCSPHFSESDPQVTSFGPFLAFLGSFLVFYGLI